MDLKGVKAVAFSSEWTDEEVNELVREYHNRPAPTLHYAKSYTAEVPSRQKPLNVLTDLAWLVRILNTTIC